MASTRKSGTPDNTAEASVQAADGLPAASASASALKPPVVPVPVAAAVVDAKSSTNSFAETLALKLSQEAEIQEYLQNAAVKQQFSKLKLDDAALALEIAKNAIQHVLEETADVLSWFKQPNSIIYYKSKLYAVMRQLSLKLDSASKKTTVETDKYFADSAVHHKEVPQIAAEVKSDAAPSKKKKKAAEVEHEKAAVVVAKTDNEKKFKLKFKSYLSDKSFDAKVENARAYIPVCIGFNDAISGEQLKTVVARYKAAGIKEVYLFIPKYDDHKFPRSEWQAEGAKELLAWLVKQDLPALKNVKLLTQGPLDESVRKYLDENGIQYVQQPLSDSAAYKAANADTSDYLKDKDVRDFVYDDAKAYLVRGLKAYQHSKNVNAGATPPTTPPLPSPPAAAAKPLTTDAPSALELPAAAASAGSVPGQSVNGASTTAALMSAMVLPQPLAMAGGTSTVSDKKMGDVHAANAAQPFPVPPLVLADPKPSDVPPLALTLEASPKGVSDGAATPRFLALAKMVINACSTNTDPKAAAALGSMLGGYGRGRGGGMAGSSMFYHRPPMPAVAESPPQHTPVLVTPVPGSSSNTNH